MSTRPTWVFTVASPTNSSAPISALLRPCPMSPSTSRSRGVNRSRPGASTTPEPAAAGPGRRAKSSMRRRVTAGASSASPPATTRTACTRSSRRTSLSRNPLAPARRASYTYSSRSNVVRITTFTGSATSGPARRRVASMPSTRGMRTSMSTTWARSRRATRTASSPSAASPTTARSGWASTIMANPLRTSSWSSATTTRTTAAAGEAPVDTPAPYRGRRGRGVRPARRRCRRARSARSPAPRPRAGPG
jgi:hypothetical protein